MKPIPVAAALAAAVSVALAALLVTGCGTASPSGHATVTVTVTAPTAPASGSAGQTATPSPGAAPACATTVLKGSLGPGSAAAGSSYYPIVFTNTSGSTCTLYGYPGVSFVSGSGGQVGAPATEDPVYPRQLVTLAAGGTAHAQLRVAAAQNYPSSTCSPVAVSTLKVFPPGQTGALLIPITSTGCTSTSVQILDVQTVQPGSG